MQRSRIVDAVPIESGVSNRVLAVAFAATAVIAVVEMVRAFRRPHLVETYQASQFWLTYEHGFIRRGLPGEVLALLTGGSPTAAQVTAAAFVLLVVGVGALVVLVLATLRFAAAPAAPTVAALLVCSPFTFALVLQDIGRYDAIGLAALAVVVVGAMRWTRLCVVLGSGLALLVAAAAEEILAAFVAPIAALATWRALPRPGCPRRVAAVAAAVLPGLVLAVWGLVSNPPNRVLLAAVDRANAVRPDIMRSSPVNAIASLSQDLDDALTHLGEMAPYVMPLLNVVLGGCFLVTATLVWHLSGRREPVLFWSLAAWCATAAVGLGVAGIDYRRWWALAFVTMVAAIPLLRGKGDAAVPAPVRWLARPAILTCVLALSVVGQPLPVGAAILLDPAAQTHIILTDE